MYGSKTFPTTFFFNFEIFEMSHLRGGSDMLHVGPKSKFFQVSEVESRCVGTPFSNDLVLLRVRLGGFRQGNFFFVILVSDVTSQRWRLTCDIRGSKSEIFKIGPKLKVWTSGVDFWLTFEAKLRKKSISPPAGCLGALGVWLGLLGGLSDFRGRGPKKSKKSENFGQNRKIFEFSKLVQMSKFRCLVYSFDRKKRFFREK